MKDALQSTRGRSRLRWAAAIGCVAVVQVGLVLALSEHSPLQRPARLNTELVLPRRVVEEFRALTDPTLLALGSPRGFSALWLQPTEPPPLDPDSKQPLQWLSLDTSKLGRAFLDYAHSNVASLHGLAFKVPPQGLSDSGSPEVKPLRTASTLHVTGDLAGRKILRAPELPSWTATDLLLPSEVRVVVDDRGLVISAILESASGSKEADLFAVQTARELRFGRAPQSRDKDSLTLGRLVFEWQALRAKATPPQAP